MGIRGGPIIIIVRRRAFTLGDVGKRMESVGYFDAVFRDGISWRFFKDVVVSGDKHVVM
jgi:hypothetical protein